MSSVAGFANWRERFYSRRSVVYGEGGAVATSQPIAAQAALNVLRGGGNAVDAAVTAMAANSVIEPMSCGLGGDVFALVWPTSGDVVGLNGSGPASKRLDAEPFLSSRSGLVADIEGRPGLGMTVPGAIRAWEALLSRFGSRSLAEALAPAQDLASRGFIVPEITAWNWARHQARLSVSSAGRELLTSDGGPPSAGTRMKLPSLAKSLAGIIQDGADALYLGEMAESICITVNREGGVLEAEDLDDYAPEWVTPLCESYLGVDVYQLPPTSHGLATLLALRRQARVGPFNEPHDTERVLNLIDNCRVALEVSQRYIGDSDDGVGKGLEILGNAESPDSVFSPRRRDRPGDTAYVAAVDGDGMGCSLMASLYEAFGSGVVVGGTGIALQNRGDLFSTERNHPNVLAPGKRPYHTLMPALLGVGGSLLGVVGAVGGFRQPQAQAQIIALLAEFGLDAQSILDAPRFGIDVETGTVKLELGLPLELEDALREQGHQVEWLDGFARGFCGSAQIVMRTMDGVLAGGSDPRKDGLVAAY